MQQLPTIGFDHWICCPQLRFGQQSDDLNQ